MSIFTTYQASFQARNSDGLRRPGFTSVGFLSLVVLLLLANVNVRAQCVNPPASVTGCDVRTKPIRIDMNTTGIVAPDAEGRVFQSYTNYKLEGVLVQTSNTITNTNTGAPNGTSSQALYQNSVEGYYLDWHFAVPNGSYTIVLHYAETYWGSANQRVFDVYLEDTKVEDNFDIFVAAGNAQNRALTKKYNVAVTGNDLAVRFESEADRAAIRGIEIIPNFCVATQSVAINKAAVSGCYSTTAGSRATVSVEVAWNNALPTDSIKVALGAQTRWIYPGQYNTPGGIGTIRSPQVVAFEIPANGAPGTVTTSFTNNTNCAPVSANIVAPPACPPTVCAAGNLGGVVFNDYNANGTKDAGETFGTAGVTVTIIDCNNTITTTTSDINGVWSISTPITYPVRVEFSNLPNFVGVGGTPNGTNGRTTTQFVSAASCTVDLGVLNQTDYCQTMPDIFLPCYVNGDPLTGGSAAGAIDAFVRLPYGASGLTPPITQVANAAQVGSLWGVAYDKKRNKVYSSAFLRRHAGMGPLGLGGIYITDGTTNVTSNLIDVQATLGIDVGSQNAGDPFFGQTNSVRGLNASPTASSYDPVSFSLIGKVGMGDLDISEDSDFLYFTNLFDKKLYKLSLTSGTPTLVASYVIPSACTNGTSRPFGLKVKGGKVYIGVVCDGSTSQNPSDMRAYVYTMDESTGTFSTAFDFPLTYPKGFPLFSAKSVSTWNAWTDDFEKINLQIGSGNAIEATHPQPMLTAIELDLDGSLILGFGDRAGFQMGWENYGLTGTKIYQGYSGGDILRAAYKNGTYLLENNAYVAGLTGSSPNNNQGPGFGEFYNDDYLNGAFLAHSEIALGALALRPGSGQTIFTTMDPLNNNPDAGGFRYISNTTGTSSAGAQVYYSGAGSTTATFGKSVGLGDIELNCGLVSYLEIGNRVWLDQNKDGVQDACEKPLAGVKVALYKGNTLIANTTTDANGEYYFSAKSKLTNGTWLGTAADTTLLPTTAYSVRFGTDGTTNQFASNVLTVANGTYQLTTAFSTAPAASTINDSNPVVTGGFASATVTTGSLGSVNHTIDAGFYCLTTTASVTTIAPTCNGTSVNSNGRVNVTNIQNADKVFLVAAGSALPSYTAVSSQPVSASAASFTGLSNPSSTSGQSYSVVIYNGPCCYTVLTTTLPQTNCCNLTATVGTPVCNGNTYTVSGTVSLTVTPAQAQTLTIRDNGVVQTTVNVNSGQTTASFSLTGLSNGSSHTVTVSSSNSVCAATATYTAPIAVSASLTSASVCVGKSVTLTATGGTSYSFSNGIVNTTGLLTFTPASSTVISVTVANSSGCTSTTSAVVTVNQPTTLPTLAPITLCEGANAAFSVGVNPGDAVYWTRPNNTTVNSSTVTITNASLTDAGNYTLTYTNANGCVSTGVRSVSVNPKPTLSIGSSGCISGNQSYTISLTTNAASLTTNAAQLGVTISGNVITAPATVTTFTVSASSAQGCTQQLTINRPNCTTVCIPPNAGPDQAFCQGTTSTTLVSPGPGEQWAVFQQVSGTSPTINQAGIPVTVSGLTLPGVYKFVLTSTSVANCSAVVTITVNPATTLPAFQTLTLCQGDGGNFGLSVAGGASAYWITPASTTISSGTVTIANATVSNAGTYTLVYTNATGCISTTTAAVVVNPKPTATLTSATICAGQPTTLTATGGTSYTFSNGVTNTTGLLTFTPASSTVISVTVANASGCVSATSATVTINPAQSLTVTSATVCAGQTATLTASGATSYTWNTGATTPSISVSVAGPYSVTGTTAAGCSATGSGKLTATSVLTPQITKSECQSASNTYSTTVVVTVNNPATGQTLTIADGSTSQPFTTTAGSSNTFTLIFNSLISDGSSHTVTASLPGCSTATATYTAPGSCTQPVGTKLTIDKLVNKSKAKIGDVMTYTLVLTNVGSTTATNLVVRDSSTTGLRYLTGSATAPAGTTFSPGAPISTWTVATIAPAQSLSLTFQAIADSSGILYNTATIPGDTAQVCTSVPVKVCPNSEYTFRLTAPAGRSSYRWFRDGVELLTQTSNVLDVTQPGSYSLAVDNVTGKCPDFSCCPFIVEEDTLPTFRATAIPVTCIGTSPQNNGQIVLSQVNPAYTYQYSLGATFNAGASLSGAAKPVPVGGVIASNLANPVAAHCLHRAGL